MSHRRPSIAAGLAAAAGLTTNVFAGDGPPGGDDAFAATVIQGIPFEGAGDTSAGYTDAFDVVCPFTGSTSPDAWYSITLDDPWPLRIMLCESAYDTKTYVLDAAFNVVGCNDDGCNSCIWGAFRSILVTDPLEAGELYYIVVDGWSGLSGAYDLRVDSGWPGELCGYNACAAADGSPYYRHEDEWCDSDGGPPDRINAGCDGDASAPEFTEASCWTAVCGTTWNRQDGHDSDWFRLPARPAASTVRTFVEADFAGRLLYFGPDPSCASPVVVEERVFDACTFTEMIVSLPADTETWWVVLPDLAIPLPCGVGEPLGNAYRLGFSCPPACPGVAAGDLDGNGVVDLADVMELLSHFGTCP